MTEEPSPTALLFEPIFQERIWGGRRLKDEFGKELPAGLKIGESWELVDRPEAQSVVRSGPIKGVSLHQLWKNHREEIFGDVKNAPRFPLLIKLLDARETLSLQVHPPAHIAPRLNGEPKTEFWYVAKADQDAKIYAGLRATTSPEEFNRSIANGNVADHIHAIKVKEGDGIFLPAGRFHAIGAGNLLVEIQQNSDTTYRVYDWDRVDDTGQPRELHIEEALQCIDFNDCQPELINPAGEVLVKDELFEIQKWNLTERRDLAPAGEFAVVCVLGGNLRMGGTEIRPGDLCLLPARSQDRGIMPLTTPASILRITIPGHAR
jgi:mannose-6-phosphate isomerase